MRGGCLCLHICKASFCMWCLCPILPHSSWVSMTMRVQNRFRRSATAVHHGRKSWLERCQIRRRHRRRRAAEQQHSIPFEPAAMGLIPPPPSLTFRLFSSSATTTSAQSGPQMPGDLRLLATHSANQTEQHSKRMPIRRRPVREHHQHEHQHHHQHQHQHQHHDPVAKVLSWARAVECSRRPSPWQDGK